MKMKVVKASASQIRPKVNLAGLSGSGKTLSALLLAKGLVSDKAPIVIIQTEYDRAQMYGRRFKDFEFDVLELEPPFQPDVFVAAIDEMVKAGYKCIIIDSVSDEWAGQGGCLQMVDSGSSKNSFANWKPVTPKHERFFNAIMQCPVPVICTTKKKKGYAMNGNVPVAVGLDDIQRDGSEYRYHIQFDIDLKTHMASVSKDNTGLFDGREPFLITDKTGKELREWCLGGKK